MRFKGLDLNLLVALDAMLEERNISRAADRLFLTQSAMSNALGRLRDHFDDKLLIQSGRNLELTPRAEILRVAVKDVLMRIDATITTPPEFIPAESDRVFRLYVSEYTTDILMPRLMDLVWKESHSIGFELLPQVNDPERVLSSGEADLLIYPSAFIHEANPDEHLYDDNYVCVVWEGNDEVGDELSLEQYLNMPHVVVKRPEQQRSMFEEWFLSNFGVTRNVQVITYSLTAPCQLLKGTNRIATVHERIAKACIQYLPLRILPPPVEIPPIQQIMQWHKYRESDPGLQWLRSKLREAAKSLTPPPPL